MGAGTGAKVKTLAKWLTRIGWGIAFAFLWVVWKLKRR
jgi:hypothetical protein